MVICVYLVEDHPLMREGLSIFLAEEGDLEVCGTAASGEEALEELARASGVDVAMIDVSLPGISGIDLVRELHRLRPELACLMLSGHGEGTYVDSSLAAGARGYVLKGNPQEITEAIRVVASGGMYVSERFGALGHR
jgi:DNA-binding NarL/FixJ family response regulator